MIKTLDFSLMTKKRIEMVDITNQIKGLVEEHGLHNGFIKLFVPHTTAGLTINENSDPYVQKDIINAMSDIVPESSNFYHVEGNSDAHLKSSLFGVDLDLLVDQGKVILGTWQSVFFCEFDGPRTRKVYVQLCGDKK